jgi:hypothetical protein
MPLQMSKQRGLHRTPTKHASRWRPPDLRPTIVDELNQDERNGLGHPRVFANQDGRLIIV